jgi:hypothetical protein
MLSLRLPVLAHFDPAKPIRHEMDALGFAIAGVLSQQPDEVCGSAEGAVCSAKGNKSAGKGH